MKKSDLLNMIKDLIDMNRELTELVMSSIEHLTTDETDRLRLKFSIEEDLAGGMEYSGCLQGMTFHMNHLKRLKKEIADRDAKEKAKNDL